MVVCAIFSEALRTLLQTIPRDLAQVNRFGGVLRDIFLGVCLDPFKMQRFAF